MNGHIPIMSSNPSLLHLQLFLLFALFRNSPIFSPFPFTTLHYDFWNQLSLCPQCPFVIVTSNSPPLNQVLLGCPGPSMPSIGDIHVSRYVIRSLVLKTCFPVSWGHLLKDASTVTSSIFTGIVFLHEHCPDRFVLTMGLQNTHPGSGYPHIYRYHQRAGFSPQDRLPPIYFRSIPLESLHETSTLRRLQGDHFKPLWSLPDPDCVVFVKNKDWWFIIS